MSAWMNAVFPLVQRLELVAKGIGDEACWNAEGSAAFAKLLLEMAGNLDALAASPDPATDEALVERVARAICDKWGYLWDGNPDDDYQVAPENNRGYDERPSRELFRSAARAAIRAMGEKP